MKGFSPLLGVTLAALAVLAVFAVPLGAADKLPAASPNREPTYQGKPLSHWVAQTKDKNPAVRAEGFKALYQMGPAGFAEIIKLLGDEDQAVRERAAHEVANASPDAKAAILPFMGLLQNERRLAGTNAAAALRDMRSAAKTSIPALKELLRHKNRGVRGQAALFLAVMAPDVKDGIPVLTEMLRDKDPGVRLAATEALVLVDEKRGIAARIELIKTRKCRGPASGSPWSWQRWDPRRKQPSRR